MSKRFREFVSHKDGVVHNAGDVADLLRKIASDHGSRLRLMIQTALANGELDDDTDFRKDLKELSKSLANSSPDQLPVNGDRHRGEQDVVTRPSADGGGGGPVGQGGESDQ